MKKIIFSGRLGSDARIQKNTTDAKLFLAFTVAEGTKEKTTWLECTKNIIEENPPILKYLKKGVTVVVSGIPYAHLSNDAQGNPVAKLKVLVTEIELISYLSDK